VFLEALAIMQVAFQLLEKRVPPPRPVTLPTGPNIRYVEQLPEQAVIQKLARVISGLKALDVLLAEGLMQEVAVIKRTLDEIGEDTHFLVIAIATGVFSDLHTRYLDYFWQEEFDAPTALASTQRRGMVKREQVRAYVMRHIGGQDATLGIEAGRTLHKTFSGFVHGASPQIMDMCGGKPPRFLVAGQFGTRMVENVESAWNYFFRGLMDTTLVAKALGHAGVVEQLLTYIEEFSAKMDAVDA
jgi:hypothetical protein